MTSKLDLPLALGPAHDARVQDRPDHLRKEGQDLDDRTFSPGWTSSNPSGGSITRALQIVIAGRMGSTAGIRISPASPGITSRYWPRPARTSSTVPDDLPVVVCTSRPR